MIQKKINSKCFEKSYWFWVTCTIFCAVLLCKLSGTWDDPASVNPTEICGAEIGVDGTVEGLPSSSVECDEDLWLDRSTPRPRPVGCAPQTISTTSMIDINKKIKTKCEFFKKKLKISLMKIQYFPHFQWVFLLQTIHNNKIKNTPNIQHITIFQLQNTTCS